MRLSNRAKRRLTLVGVGFIVLIAGAVVFKVLRGVQRDRLYEAARVDGLAAHESGDLETAIDRLSYYLQDEDHRQDVEALLAFGDARAKVATANDRHVIDAIGLYKHAVDVLDENSDQPQRDERRDEALHALVRLYGMAGLRFEQVQVADRILQSDPDDVDALAGRAMARVVDRDLDTAMLDTRRLIELEPDEITWRQLELEIMQRSQRSNSDMIARVEEWEAAHDGDGRYLVIKAGLLGSEGRYIDAQEAVREAAERGADELPVLNMMVKMLVELQMPDEAKAVVNDAKERFPDAQWVREAIVARHWQAGALAAARAELDEARADFDRLDPPLLKLDALLRLSTGSTDELPAVLDEIRERGRPDDLDDEALVAWADAVATRLERGEGDWQAGMRAIDQAIGLQRTDPALHLLKGEAFANVREFQQANEAFRDAFELNPNWLAAGMAYSASLLQVDRPDEAFVVARHVLQRSDRTTLSPYLVYAQAYVATLEAGRTPKLNDALLGKGGDLVRIFSDIYRQAPDEPMVAVLLAEVKARTGRVDEALAFLETFLEPDREPSSAMLVALARVSDRNELEVERALLERAREIDGLTIPLAVQLANIAASDERYAEGVALLDEALQRDGGDAAARRLARLTRIGLLLAADEEAGRASLAKFAGETASDPIAQSYVLSLPQTWDDEELVDATIRNLETALGARSQRAQLARARYLLEFHAEQDARLAEATLLLNDVLERSPDSVAAHAFMARASELGSQPSTLRAIKHLRRAVEIAPGQAELYPRLIGLLRAEGEYEEARRRLQQLEVIAPGDDRLAWVEVGLLEELGDFESALIRATDAAGDGSDETEQLRIAFMHWRAGDVDDAEAIYESLLERPDATWVAVEAAAHFFAEVGEVQRGLDTLATLRSRDDVNYPLLAGRFHRLQGDEDEALGWLEQAVESAPEDAAARLELARLHLDRGDFERASTHALAGLQVSPDDRDLRATLATAQLAEAGSQSIENAIATLQPLADGDDDLIAMLRYIERLETGAIDPRNRALEEARRLVDEHGDLAAVWTLASRVHARAGRLDLAIDLARRAMSRFPTDTASARLATELLAGSGRWGEALTEAEGWRRRSRTDTMPADLVIAELLLRLDRPADAVAHLRPHERRIVGEAARHPERPIIYLQAQVAADPDVTAREAATALLTDEEHGREMRARWVALSRTSGASSAARGLDLLEDLSVEDPAEMLELAAASNELAMRTGAEADFRRAERWAERAVETPRRLDALILLGAIAEAQGERDAAERRYREVLEVEPEHPIALNNLAFVLAATRRADEAVSVARQALLLNPDQPEVMDTYAHALLAAGQPAEAESVLRQALAKQPRDPAAIISTLAQALIETGDLAEADRWLRDAQAMLERGRPSRQQLQRVEQLEQQLAVKRTAQRDAAAAGDASSRRATAGGADR